MMLWQPFHLKQCMTHKLPHHETERQWSINNIWSCILGNQGFTKMNQLITELLTAFITKNTMYNRKNTDSTIFNVADCKTCKNRLLAVEYLILTIYNYPTAKTRTLYKSTDGPAGLPAHNPPNSDGLGDFHRTMPEMTVGVYWQPGPSCFQRFSSNPDPDPKWPSGTIANTSWRCALRMLFIKTLHIYMQTAHPAWPILIYWSILDWDMKAAALMPWTVSSVSTVRWRMVALYNNTINAQTWPISNPT